MIEHDVHILSGSVVRGKDIWDTAIDGLELPCEKGTR